MSISMLKVVLDFLNLGLTGENIILYHNQMLTATGDPRGRKQSLSPMEAFFLTLIRLRQNFSIHHLADLFQTSQFSVSSTITT